MYQRRFGWTDKDFAAAEDHANDKANAADATGGPYLVVEVGPFEHFVQSQPGEPVGVAYVVDDEGFDALREEFDEVIEFMAYGAADEESGAA